MKIAVYCGTRNVYKDMETAAKSLVYHTAVDKIYFLIEDDVFPSDLPEFIEVINVSNQTWFHQDGKNAKDHRTYMNLIRAALPKILSEDVVLCLDNDTIVMDDISELWDIDLEQNYYAGVCEPVKSGWYPYINMGVSLHNLKLLRDGTCNKIIHALNTNYYVCPLQDSIYQFCKEHFLLIDGCYNVSNYTEISEKPTKIFHFAAEENWQKKHSIVRFYREMEWGI